MKTIIVTGITGKLGAAYLDYFRKQKDIQCFGVARRKPSKEYKNVVYLFADLLNEKAVSIEVEKIDLSNSSEVLLVHPIGMFKFEVNQAPEKDNNKDGIDDDVYASNVLTFTNIFNSIKERVKQEVKKGHKMKLTVSAFGSITDKYYIPFWNSYTASKNNLRKIIKNSILRNKALAIHGVFVNISTADTGNERNLRPYGNAKYWLTVKEIVQYSVNHLTKPKKSWIEMNIYKFNPNFNSTWYTNHDNVLERWMSQMGGKNVDWENKESWKKDFTWGIGRFSYWLWEEPGKVTRHIDNYGNLTFHVWGESACTTYVDVGMDCVPDYGYIIRRAYSFEGFPSKDNSHESQSLVEGFNLAKQRYLEGMFK